MVHLCKWRVNSKILNPLDGPKRRFFKMPFCAIEPFWKGLTIHTLFMRSSRKKNPPGGGEFFWRAGGVLLWLYCFLKIKVFSKKHLNTFPSIIKPFWKALFCNIHCNITPFIFSFHNITDSKRLSQISSMNDANFIHDRDLN